jgi:hypothetical protein
MQGCFTTILINMVDLFMIINLNWSLRCLKSIGTILEGVSTTLPAKRPYYFDQHGRVVLKSQSKLASSVPETDRTNLGGASTIPHGKRLSYCYFDQDGKLIFRK